MPQPRRRSSGRSARGGTNANRSGKHLDSRVGDIERILTRGHSVDLLKEFLERLKNPRDPVGGLVGKAPSLDSRATSESDGSRTRVVLVKANTTDGGRASGATASLLAENGETLLDSARVDRRGLVLLRFPQGMGSKLARVRGKLRLGKSNSAIDIEIPPDQQHVVILTAIDAEDVVSTAGDAVGDAVETVEEAADGVGTTTNALEEAVTVLEEAAAALAAAADEAADQVTEAAGALTSAAEELNNAANALAELTSELSQALRLLAAEVPTDSVLSRLPISFSPALADAVTRLLEVAEGPIPGIDPATAGISVSRMPLIKQMTVRRVVGEPRGVARRFLIRIRQEWYFLGFTLGELVRVDPLDPASVTGTLDATLTAQVQAGLALDASTASKLQAALSGQLSAQAAIDSTLDIAAQARLDARLNAAAQAGIRDDPLDSFSSPGQFFGELGTSILDILLPDLGLELSANLNAALDVNAHSDLSIRSSLLAAARINTAASLVNQVRVQVSAALDASTSLRARLVAQINPSLARAVNLLRFVLYDVYAVTSRVEDVVEISEVSVFTPPPPGELLFPPADIVEYRPFFQRRLLDRTLLPHFNLLRRALADVRTGGAPIRHINILVEYSATGNADLSFRVAGHRTTIRLRAGSPVATGSIDLSPPIRPDDLTEARLTLTGRRIELPFPFPDLTGSVEVTRVEVRYDGGGDPEDVQDFAPGAFAVGPAQSTDRFDMPLDPQPLDFDPETDSLVLHVDHNQHYYLGVLAEAAIRVPSLRQDAPQLAGIGVDSGLWRLPLLGFEADRALVLTETDPNDPVVQQLVDDEGTSTIVQLAAAGLYTEAAQGRLQIAEVAGRAHPALAMTEPPLPNIQGLDVLSNAGGLGAPNLQAALAAASPLLQQNAALPNLAALAALLNATRPATPTPPTPNP